MNVLSERSNEGRLQMVQAGLEKFAQSSLYDRQIACCDGALAFNLFQSGLCLVHVIEDTSTTRFIHIVGL